MRRVRPVAHDDRLSVVEHLDELRSRLFISVVAFVAAWALTAWQNHLVLEIVNAPLPDGIEPITLGPAEAFYTTLTNSAYAALLLSLPVILYQLYAFVLPAFSPTERRVATPLLMLVPILFIAGVVFCYFVVLTPALDFLLNFNADEFNTQVRARDYYSFITLLMLAMGIGFQILQAGGDLSREAPRQPPLRDRRDRGARRAAPDPRSADADPRDDPPDPALRTVDLARLRPRQAITRGGGSDRLRRGFLTH